MDLNNCGSKVVGSRHFFLSKSLWNNWYTIVLIGERMKPPKDISYVLVEYNSFLKQQRQMKGCILMIYIQEYILDSEGIIKDSMFQWRLFVIQKLMISYMIGFHVYNLLPLYNGCLETAHINNKTIIHFSIQGQEKLLKLSAIQSLSIKLMDIWMQGVLPHQ